MSTSKKVVIAEDEDLLLKSINFILEEKGYKTFTAGDGEQAIELIKKEKPDIALLDVLMPKKNGLDVLRELRADPEIASTPVLLLTNLSDEDTIAQGVLLGVKGYFVKADISLDEIAKKVAEVIGT